MYSVFAAAPAWHGASKLLLRGGLPALLLQRIQGILVSTGCHVSLQAALLLFLLFLIRRLLV